MYNSKVVHQTHLFRIMLHIYFF